MVCVGVVGCGEWCGVGCRDGVCGCGGVWGVVWGRVSGWYVWVWWGVGSGVG